jgi:hypothetical protein
MGISIEAARKKLYSAYNIDVDKYSNDETMDKFGENLEAILSFRSNFILPVIISGVIALLIAIASSYFLHSTAFGILFFIFSIPIFLFGIGALSFAKAAEGLFEGISFILGFSINVTKDIRSIISKECKASPQADDLTLLVLYGIVFPIVKKTIRNNPLDNLLYFIIQKCVQRGYRKIKDDNAETETYSSTDNGNRFFTVSEKVKAISNTAVKYTAKILKILGISFICIGSILIGLQYLIFFIFAK